MVIAYYVGMNKKNNNLNKNVIIQQENQENNELMALKSELAMLRKEINRYNKEMELVHEFSMYLQSCLSLAEAHPVIRHYISKMFPQWVGGLYLFNDEKILAESAVTWGSQSIKSANIITHEDCWALRRIKSHISLDDYYRVKCNHVEDDVNSYICTPVIVQNDTLGALHIEYFGDMIFETDEAKQHYFDSCQKLVKIVADNLSSSFASLKLRKTLQNQSIRDPLTSLYNRRYMEECMKSSIAKSARSGDGIGVIMIDIDHFKKINDAYGHAAGDIVLSEFAKVATNFFREEDIICRYGGEEFMIIMETVTQEQVMKRATDFCHKLRDFTMQCDSVSLPKITASFGVIHSDRSDNFKQPSEMIKMADAALYKAKKLGRDQVVLYKNS